MADFNKFYPKILNFEGGYQDDPADTGNYYNHKLIGTNMGVSAPTLAAYLKREPTVADMKALTKDSVIHIMKTLYWDRWKADLINNQSIAEICVDWVWASGEPGITKVQELLNIDADGHVGNITLASVNDTEDQEELFKDIKRLRLNFILGITAKSINDYCKHLMETEHREATNEDLMKHTYLRFKQGWIDRVNAFKFEP